LIAVPNVDKANRRQEKGIRMQQKDSRVLFCKLIGRSPSMKWVGLRKGKWGERLWFPSIVKVLNSLKFRLLPKNRQKRQAVVLKKCQLARHKESRSEDQEIVLQCLRFANITIRQCKHGCKKKKKKRKEKKEKERNSFNQLLFVL